MRPSGHFEASIMLRKLQTAHVGTVKLQTNQSFSEGYVVTYTHSYSSSFSNGIVVEHRVAYFVAPTLEKKWDMIA